MFMIVTSVAIDRNAQINYYVLLYVTRVASYTILVHTLLFPLRFFFAFFFGISLSHNATVKITAATQVDAIVYRVRSYIKPPLALSLQPCFSDN